MLLDSSPNAILDHLSMILLNRVDFDKSEGILGRTNAILDHLSMTLAITDLLIMDRKEKKPHKNKGIRQSL